MFAPPTGVNVEYCHQKAWQIVFQELHAVTFDDVINAAHSDHQYQDLLKIVSEDFPTKHSLTEPTHLQEFWEVGDRLST